MARPKFSPRPTKKQREWIKLVLQWNAVERVQAAHSHFANKEAPVSIEPNPRYDAAHFELSVVWPNGKPTGLQAALYPPRYVSIEAGQLHQRTGQWQPEHVPPYLWVWPDGTKSEMVLML